MCGPVVVAWVLLPCFQLQSFKGTVPASLLLLGLQACPVLWCWLTQSLVLQDNEFSASLSSFVESAHLTKDNPSGALFLGGNPWGCPVPPEGQLPQWSDYGRSHCRTPSRLNVIDHSKYVYQRQGLAYPGSIDVVIEDGDRTKMLQDLRETYRLQLSIHNSTGGLVHGPYAVVSGDVASGVFVYSFEPGLLQQLV